MNIPTSPEHPVDDFFAREEIWMDKISAGLQSLRGYGQQLPLDQRRKFLAQLLVVTDAVCSYQEAVIGAVGVFFEDAANLQRQRDLLVNLLMKAIGEAEGDAVHAVAVDVRHRILEGFFFGEAHRYVAQKG